MELSFTDEIQLKLLIILIILFAVALALFMIAEWRILKKAGEKGWKAFIPFYSVYVSHHIVGMSHVWFIIEAITWVLELLFELLDFIPQPVVLVFGIVMAIFTAISELVHIIKMCDCFGKGTGFKIGMVLIPDLFLMILAFGKSEYRKPGDRAN